jgi:hypothetical protein
VKTYQTNKLFYNKWPYRIETYIPGAYIVKNWGVDQAKTWCTNEDPSKYPRYIRAATKVNKIFLYDYIIKIEPYLHLKTRTEGDILNFYLDDTQLYKNMQKELRNWILSVTEPASDEDLKILKVKTRQNLCKQLPYNTFTHKVHIKHTMPTHFRDNFLKWIDNYSGAISPSKGTLRWLKGTHPYFITPFLYVTDAQLLSLVGLFLGNYLQSTEEYVLRDTLKCR